MGVLSDLIIADRSEAQAINAAEGGHYDRWPCLDSKGLDPIKLGTLWAILSGSDYDPEFMGEEATLDEPSEEGPWLMLVPPEMVAALAAISSDQQAAIAARWAQTEEFELDGYPAEAVSGYLTQLVPFAQQAQTAEKDVLLWMSL